MVGFASTISQLLLLSAAAAGVQGQTFTNSTKAHSPPRYPSPWIQGSGDWQDAYAKAKDFVSQLTLLEKINITTGTGWQMDHCVGNVGSLPRLGISALCLQDSPTGIRFGTYSSAFPSGMNAAMTWDRNLIYNRGMALAQEFKGKGVNVMLGPVAGPLGREPEGGRNWEGFSADPFLTGIGIAETIKGIQDAGVVATAKHFIGNEQENFRQIGEASGFGFNITEPLSSNIDDRTMHELYMWPFADAVRAGVGAVMCVYTQINNSQGCQNSYMLNGLLKGELDFQGFVVSDWQAQHSGVDSVLAGLDMAMPGDTLFDSGASYYGSNLTVAVLNGTLPESKITDMATRIMAAIFKVGQDLHTYPATNFDSWTTDDLGFAHFFAKKDFGVVNQQVDVRGDHYKIIQEIAAKGTILLKNEGALPLSKEKQIGIFGSDMGEALYGPNACSDRGCDNGTLAIGWGSGTANFPYLITPLEAIKARALREGSVVQSVLDDYAYAQITTTARQATTCIVGVSADSGEGYIDVDDNRGDRKNLTLWNSGDILINTVAAQCNNTVVVIHAVGVVLVEEWIDHPNVTAVLFAGLPGQESGHALTQVLYGDINPSGKLPFTWGKKASDYGTNVLYEPNGLVPQVNFNEGLFIDYRHFDKENIEPRFEFGYGLSYTNFTYSQLYVARIGTLDYTPASGFTPALQATNATTDFNPSDYLFPKGFNSSRIPDFIYPYIESTDVVKHPGVNSSASYAAPPGAFDTSAQPIPAAGGAPGGNPSLYEDVYQVTCLVENTGTVAGEEVVQVYIATGLEDDPVVVLRGFEKVSLVPGQSTMVRINLNRRDLARWDVSKQDWVITNNPKEVRVGGSSRSTPLVGTLPV